MGISIQYAIICQKNLDFPLKMYLTKILISIGMVSETAVPTKCSMLLYSLSKIILKNQTNQANENNDVFSCANALL